QSAGSLPVTNSGFLSGHHVLPIGIGCAGLVLAWSANELSGVLISVVAVSILGGRRASLVSAAALGVALAALILVVGWESLLVHETTLRIAVCLAVGLGISTLVHLDQVARSSGLNERRACAIVQSMPAHASSADPEGNFTNISPSEHRLQQL